MVFQSYALYPHMTVRENMIFALKIAKLPGIHADMRDKEIALTADPAKVHLFKDEQSLRPN